MVKDISFLCIIIHGKKKRDYNKDVTYVPKIWPKIVFQSPDVLPFLQLFT